MEEMQTKEKNMKKAKRKMALLAILMTIIIVFIVVIAVAIFLGIKGNDDTSFVVPNSYSFTGNVLSTNKVNKTISFVTEEKDNAIYGVTLKNNELVSQITLCDNFNYEEINDFGIAFNGNVFSYFDKKDGESNLYNIYEIDGTGNIVKKDGISVMADSKKASIKVSDINGKYSYETPYFYYDSYKLKAEIGNYELTSRKDIYVKPISKNSKIAIVGKYKAIPRKVNLLKEFPEYLQNSNSYLKKAESKQVIEVDLDGNGDNEYIVAFSQNKKTMLRLFDNFANSVTNILSVDGEKNISELVEIVDIDNDGIMEVVCGNEKNVEVHKYNNGFYY